MNVLLDTHSFLWWVTDDAQLSNTAKTIISNPNNTIYFSVASAWEIIIKEQTGKLSLPETPDIYIPSRLASNHFLTLSVQMQHVLQLTSLPNYHKDPFDRLLVVQSQVEKLPILTIDSVIHQYPITVIW